MLLYPNNSDKKGLKISVGMIIVGLLIVGFAFLPFMNPPQCPGNAVTMADGSRCIIGVNMGAASVWMLGMAIVFVGIFCLIGLLIVNFIRRFGNKKIL
jgi:hypothetical protein